MESKAQKHSTKAVKTKAVKSKIPDRYDVYIDGTKYWHGTKRQVEAIAAKYGFTVEFTQGAEL